MQSKQMIPTRIAVDYKHIWLWSHPSSLFCSVPVFLKIVSLDVSVLHILLKERSGGAFLGSSHRPFHKVEEIPENACVLEATHLCTGSYSEGFAQMECLQNEYDS